MEFLKGVLDWLLARFDEFSTWQGVLVVLGSLVLFGVVTGPIKVVAAVCLAALGAYLIVKSRD